MAQEGATLWLKDGWIFVRTPYDKTFVEKLKSTISSVYRRWDPAEKLWKVDPSQDEKLVELVTSFFGAPTILEDKEVIVVAESTTDAYGTLLRLAPDDVLKKVFRLIAAAVHPDAGGTGEKMAQANSAWNAIKQDRGW